MAGRFFTIESSGKSFIYVQDFIKILADFFLTDFILPPVLYQR